MGKVIFLMFCHILCVSTHRVSRSVAESDSVNRDDNDGTCLLESTPKLDSLYCKAVLQSFESNLNQVLQKIEEKIEHFDVEKGCRKGWHKYGMHCYYFSKDKMSWHQARDYCQLEGSADLLSVRDDAEHEYILDKLKNLVPDEDGAIHLWIGLHDLHREGMYQWYGRFRVRSSEFIQCDRFPAYTRYAYHYDMFLDEDRVEQ
ncbi:CD209 antigen-like protein D [Glandiceps talaboti]